MNLQQIFQNFLSSPCDLPDVNANYIRKKNQPFKNMTIKYITLPLVFIDIINP